MKALLRNELFKLVRSKAIRIFVLFTWVIVVLNLHSYRPGGTDISTWTFWYGQSAPLAMIEIFAQLMIIFLPVIAGEMITDDYRQGTLKLSLLQPVTRRQLLGAKMIALVILVCMMAAFFVVTTYVAGTYRLGWGDGAEYYGRVYDGLHGIVVTISSYLLLVAPLATYGLAVIYIAVIANQMSATVITSLVLMTLLLNMNDWERVAKFTPAYYVANFHEHFTLGIEWSTASIGIAVLVAYAVCFYLLSQSHFVRKQLLY